MNVEMYDLEIKKKVRAIVMFGPATATSGLRPAEYYEAVVDPNMVSPKRDYIRFGFYDRDEINGWQRVQAITICEVLSETEQEPRVTEGYVFSPESSVVMKAVKS